MLASTFGDGPTVRVRHRVWKTTGSITMNGTATPLKGLPLRAL